MIFYSADYDGLELRTMAQCCLVLVGFSRLAEALNAGRDPHLELAANMLGIPYEEAKRRYDAKDPIVIEARQAGKVGNFGFAGGLGVDKLVLFARKQYKVRMSREKSVEVKAGWLNTWPEFRLYLDRASEWSRMRYPCIQLYTGRVRGGCSYTKHANSPFQGLGADATGAAAFLIAKHCYTPQPCLACQGAANGCEWCRPCHGPGISALYGSRQVNYVHDEFIGECCEPWGHEIAHELVRAMKLGAAPFIPDVPATAKPLLSRYWSKEAEPRWIEEVNAPGGKGRLVPWPN